MASRQGLAFKDVHDFIASVVGEDLHARRVYSLANASQGVIASASLAVSTIGHGLAEARGLLSKHAIKQVDRLLSNAGIEVETFFPRWVPYPAEPAEPGILQEQLRALVQCLGGRLRVLHQLLAGSLEQHFTPSRMVRRPAGLAHGTTANTKYFEITLGWQHWLSPQIEFRPEVGYWRSFDTKAFNGNSIAGIAANKNYTVRIPMIAASDSDLIPATRSDVMPATCSDMKAATHSEMIPAMR